MEADTKLVYAHHEFLDSSNYHTWKFRMELLLQEKGLERFIKEDYNLRVTSDNRNDLAKKDGQCKWLIVRNIKDDQIEIVRNKRTAYKIWSVLKELYEKKGIQAQVMLERKLMNLKLQEEDRLDEFIVKFEDLVNQLKKCGAEIPERNLVTKLLLALPSSFDVIVTLIENMPIEELTVENIKVKLRHEMEKRKGKVECDGVNNSEEEKPTIFFSKNLGTCFGCGRRG